MLAFTRPISSPLKQHLAPPGGCPSTRQSVRLCLRVQTWLCALFIQSENRDIGHNGESMQSKVENDFV